MYTKNHLRDIPRLIITYSSIFIMFTLVWLYMPSEGPVTGPILFVPVIFMLVFIFLTKRMIEGFIWALLLIGFMITHSLTDMFTHFIDGTYKIMSSEDYQWIIFVSTCAGSLIALIKLSGSIQAFSQLVLKFSKSKRSSLISIWLLNLLTFFDEYLHFMVMGPSTLPVAKERKISKELLTYIMKSTGVAVGTLLPMSIWTFFIAKQFESFGIADMGDGISLLMQLIPLNFFTWISVLISFLVVLGIIPIFGPMKKAEELAEQGIYSQGGGDDTGDIEQEISEKAKNKKSTLTNFFVPLILLFGLIFYFDFDSAKGAIIALMLTSIFYVAKDLLTPLDCQDAVINGGIKDMVYMFVIILLALMFSASLETLGFVSYIIDLVDKSNVNPAIFPLLIFLIFSFTEFAVSLNWGLFVLVFPMVEPMANSVGASPVLCLAAVLSAVMFGTNASPISESTIMPCSFTNTNPMDHTMANLPYQLIAFVISAMAFLIAGFVM
ncbi:Na+/H+ antiporter NhaC family protein [Budvicia aquatica]|uniref:Na+/H+ antiporter NhaC-like C-terminal domain-containing protein n=2 Tax=Budvicia aquatica TaxID=82979 RepID=A0A2C6DSS9_9GAMM|nr:Na+/H+ antiporter NhaC family protein [Budvicia aquatica]PHI32267.1 hypothetical protein CRN84_24585 [Budvicia aquatica]